MPTRIAARALLCLLALLAAGLFAPGAARPAAAQCTDILLCPSGGPGVSIEPDGGSWNGSGATMQVVVTISFCDESAGFSSASRRVYLNGVDVTSSFGWGGADPVAGCFTVASSAGVVTLTPGSHVLVASITSTSGQFGSDTVTFHYSQGSEPPVGPYGLRVTPDARAVDRAPGVRATERFTVTNRGSNPTTVAMAPVCTGAGASGCGASLGSLTIPGGGTVSVGVNYLAGSAGAAATVGLAAWRSGDSASVNDAGSYQVTVKPVSPRGEASDTGYVTALDRSACLMLPAMLDAAYECGDLRLAHALPATRVLNRGFAPTLLYSSQHAHPYPIVAATVTPAGPTAPTSVVATLTIAGVTRADTFPGWTGAAKRVAVGLDATGLTSGFYGYTFQVKAHYASGQLSTLVNAGGTLPIVNRHASRFGRGWWLAGLEEVKPFGTTLMWIGGDGSTLRYDSVGAGRWASEKYAGTDTIVRMTGGGYARLITGGDSVVFDAQGRHLRTASQRGTRTDFTWTNGALTAISLPRGSAFNSGMSYVLDYLNPYDVLSKVTAPSTGAARVVAFLNDDRRVTAISGPDTTSVHFGYADARPRITSRRDRRGVWTYFGYNAGSRLSSAHTVTGAGPNDYVPVYYLPQESRGIGTAVPEDQVYTVFNGPRPDGDVADYVYFWVDRRGAPYMMQENGGAPTRIRREDPSWPGLVTRVTHADGREVTSSYDHAGRLSSTTDWGRASNGRYATTLYEWDERCNALSRVTLPEGEVTTRGYTAQCLPEWVQPGHQLSRRVTFAYEPATHASAPGLTASVTEPGGHVQRLGYDARGNLASVISPVNDTTFFESDAIGRLARARTPIQAGLFRVDTTEYDVRDRAVRAESRGPAIPNGNTGAYLAGAQTVVVRTEYDAEGAVVEVMRRGSPDVGIDSITTRWKHDALRRVVAELAPDNTPASWSDNPRDTTVYNEAGLPVWVLTRRGDTLRTRYDALGRPKWSYHSAVRYDSTSRGVPSLGLSPATCRPLAQTPAEHVYPLHPNAPGCALLIPADSAVFKYDPMGRLVEARNAAATVRRGYHGDGLLSTETLVIKTMAGDSSPLRGAYVLSYDYDLNGRRTRLTHPSAIAPVANAVTQYTYDPATGALASVTDPLGNHFAFRYDARGQLDSLGMPGGMRQRFDHDADGRMSRYRAWVPSESASSPLSDVTFGYDRRGKMLESTDAGLGQETMSARYSGLGHLVRSIYGSTAQISGTTAMSETTAWMVYDGLGNSYQTVNSTDGQTTGTGIWSPRFGSLSQRSNASTFQRHTGRLLYNYDAEVSRELTYDAAGNVAFEQTGWLDASKRGRDRVSYYGADGKLWAVDARLRSSITDASATWEEYRHDPLGRRVQVLTREWCSTGGASCNHATVRRTVWDGDQVLYEIRMAESEGDSDGAPSQQPPGANNFSLNAMLGRILLTHGPGIDQPLSAIRMGYGDYYATNSNLYQAWGAFSVIPLWNQRGQAPFVAFGNGLGGSTVGTRQLCPPGFADGRCLGTRWLLAWDAYGARPNGSVLSSNAGMKVWLGGIMDDQQDASGLLYRRNRYYDPSSGRFTQEDPIGLAGGINLYGFANGDPVMYSDPFGLSVCFNGRGGATTFRQIVDNAMRLARGAADATNMNLSLRQQSSGDWCITSAKAASGNTRYSSLQRRFRRMIQSNTTYFIASTRGKSIWEEKEKTAYINLGDVGAPIQGCNGTIMRASAASLIAHELFGHGTEGGLRRTRLGQFIGVNETYATNVENEYHSAASPDTRCRGSGVEDR